MSKRSLLSRARGTGGDVLARRLVEVGAGGQRDRDLRLGLGKPREVGEVDHGSLVLRQGLEHAMDTPGVP